MVESRTAGIRRKIFIVCVNMSDGLCGNPLPNLHVFIIIYECFNEASNRLPIAKCPGKTEYYVLAEHKQNERSIANDIT